MKFYWLLLGILSVWRITSLLGREDGPWDFFATLRQKVGAGFFGKMLDCFYCLSLWIAAPFGFLIGETWIERFLLWLAFSAGAIALDRLTNIGHNRPPALYFEDKEKEDALLRTTEHAISDERSDNPTDS